MKDLNFLKHKDYILGFLVILVFFLGFYYMGLNKNKTVSLKEEEKNLIQNSQNNLGAQFRKIDYDKEFEKWRGEIRSLGPAKAYEEFKNDFKNDHFQVQHSVAHIFGEILFDEEGLEGLAYCDSTFAFGCFHSFFGKALYILGESIVSDLDKVCINKYGEFGTGCQHGIGHGLVQYSGYNNLIGALELCSLTTQRVAIFGCTSGVFMEYNVPLVDLGKDKAFVTKSRELNPLNPYEPCDTLPHKFRESCYYEMGQWWDKVYSSDYSKIGKLCENIPDQEFKHSCFLGIGNVVAPTTDYSVETSKKICSLMPNKEATLSCRSGASWSFFADPDYRHLSPKMCEDLDEKTKIQCAKDSDLIGNGLK